MLCDTFLHLARDTWDQMMRNYISGILVREDAMTSMNLQELKIQHPHQVRIKDFTPHEESKQTGADWEWWFIDEPYAIGFAVQAKRLDKGSYDVGYKPQNNPLQIETLLKYCSNAGDITPLYCFYNYFPHEFVGADAWGCALADGYNVYAKHLNKKYLLGDIQPISRPWHELVCGFNDKGIRYIWNAVNNLAASLGQIPKIALPNGVNKVPIMQRNGLPKRVLAMLSSKGASKILAQNDPPIAYPKRLVIIERNWPKSERFN